MKEITTVGLDLAKNVFQVHAVDAAGAVVILRQVRRAQALLLFSRLTPCLIGLEACAGAHYWARELAKLGHEVRLCEERAKQEGFGIVETYADRAVSGASMLRPGLQALMADALAGRFTVVVAEVTCHGIFPPSATRVRPKEGTDDEANDTNRRADHWHPAGA